MEDGAELEGPHAVGLVDTVLKKCSEGVIVDVMSASKTFSKSIMPKIYIYIQEKSDHESSYDNMVCSISVYYSGQVWKVNKSIIGFIRIAATRLQVVLVLERQIFIFLSIIAQFPSLPPIIN